jgi:uncharacterized membrane protein
MILEYTNKIMGSRTININDIFFGSEQSKYAGIALFMTIMILCVIILFSSSRIPIGDRFMFVLFILIISVPSILMSLFELTCIVTGGNLNTRWWCWLLAWVLAVIIIVYCVMIIISMLISMSEYDMANDRLDYSTEKNKMGKEEANLYAKKIIIDDKISQQKQESKPVVYNTPLASSSPATPPPAPAAPSPPMQPTPPVPVAGQSGQSGQSGPVISAAHRTPSSHNGQAMNSSNSSLHGVNSQPPHYQEPKVSDVNSLPYPKSSADDIYMNYAPLDGGSAGAANAMSMQQRPRPSPMMPPPSQQSNNSVSSFNGYDSTDNYSSY